ncbi:hypothetical protein JSQ81_10350 [Sporosarcina sp. Marseille-Q4063]|uniref:hypothetical protein n=1 Tax=Sporosarcina sp. Marseille-Q4063 TaxID=2810514 RepID=UPI001BAED957|nr:hypothetical protein [Sporosarcina sp. Marseille-Q4063]QUW20280.1 hypothetical protein JSQ81_10350 [Sporosarcina sp. Marseille-Q4063]
MKMNNFEIAKGFIVNIIAVNENSFVLTLEDIEKIGMKRELYYLFIDNNLSNITLTQLKHEETIDIVDSKKLENFYGSFPSVDENGKYKELFNRVDILDTNKNKLIKLKKDDLLSNDGKFVYIDGDKEQLGEGSQRIQAIENYIEGNDIYESEFELKYKHISKKLGLKTSGAGIVKINYFNKDYIVLSIKFDGVIVGEAGFTNVIIDLQDDHDNPTAYLVDLSIATPVKVK